MLVRHNEVCRHVNGGIYKIHLHRNLQPPHTRNHAQMHASTHSSRTSVPTAFLSYLFYSILPSFLSPFLPSFFPLQHFIYPSLHSVRPSIPSPHRKIKSMTQGRAIHLIRVRNKPGLKRPGYSYRQISSHQPAL